METIAPEKFHLYVHTGWQIAHETQKRDEKHFPVPWHLLTGGDSSWGKITADRELYALEKISQIFKSNWDYPGFTFTNGAVVEEGDRKCPSRALHVLTEHKNLGYFTILHFETRLQNFYRKRHTKDTTICIFEAYVR